MRRRLRERLRVREALLLDLGALVYELHRQGKRAPELLQDKAAELSVIDEEVRELEAALDGATASEAGPEGAHEQAEEAHEGEETLEAEETHEADALEPEEREPEPDAELDAEDEHHEDAHEHEEEQLDEPEPDEEPTP